MAQEQIEVQLAVSANLTEALAKFKAGLDEIKGQEVSIPIKIVPEGDSAKAVVGTRKEIEKTSRAADTTVRILSKQRDELNRIYDASAKTYKQGEGQRRQRLFILDTMQKTRKEIDRINASLTVAEAVSRKWSRALDQSKDSVKKVGAKGPLDSLIGKLTVGGLAVEAFKQATEGLTDLLNTGVQFEQLNLSLQAFTGSSENAQQAYESFKDTALKTPFDIKGVAEAGKTLLAFEVPIESALKATRQLSIIAGATGSNLNNLARNLGQISAQGRAYTRDLNQFATAGIPIYKQLAVTLGVSIEEVRNFAEEGKIGFAEVQAAITAMTASGTAFANLAERQLSTVAGQLGNTQTAVQELAGEFIKLYGPTIVKGLENLTDLLGTLKENFTILGSTIQVVSTAILLRQFAPAINGVINAIGVLRIGLPAAKQAMVLFAEAARTGNPALVQQAQYLANLGGAAGDLVANIKKAIVSGVLLTAAIVAIVASLAAFKDLVDSFQPIDSVKEDTENIKALRAAVKALKVEIKDDPFKDLSKSLVEVEKSIKGAGAGILELIPGVSLLTKDTLGQAGAVNKARVSLKEYGENTTRLVKITNSLTASNQEYLQSSERTNDETVNRLSLVRTSIDSAQKQIQILEIQADSEQKYAETLDRERGVLGRLNGTMNARVSLAYQSAAASKARLEALKGLLPSLEQNEQALSGINQVEDAFAQFMRATEPTMKQRTELLKLLTEETDDAADKFVKLAKAQTELNGADLAKSERALKSLNLEFAAAKAPIDNYAASLQNAIAKLDNLAQLEARQALGKDIDKESLGLQIKLYEFERARLKTALVGLDTNSETGVQLQLQLNQNEKNLALARAQYRQADERYKLDGEILDNTQEGLRLEGDRLQATGGLTIVIAEQAAALDRVNKVLNEQVAKIQLQKTEVELVAGTVDTGLAKSYENVNKLLDDAIVKLGLIRQKSASLPGGNESNSEPAWFTNPFNYRGGPVRAGALSTVNELGKEAFLSNSGRLSMIPVGAFGTWRAPEAGTVIPAHLTKLLDIPAGGVNVNSPAVALANRRAAHAGGGHDTAETLRKMHSLQNEQAAQLGKLTRAIGDFRDKEWKVDLNINGNNPLLSKLRRH